ncbi:hypothetical protein AH775_18745 [Salmonella enterica subsp. enterica serovar Give]|nr:hypothetical protein [Salmonella enterica subsp. enterica serovar Manchester]ECI2791858.1 hypothetical protein [Salmonella enterica subsp. enterica serovar Give]ECO0044642.1 hypothetical protein [Salmonella enterica subsp. enterica serovar Infantis]EDG5395609.1 hypothetical protein [Salmonella enterica subsp. enterica serovar Bovismorbificans]EGZ3890944.1 hypothetical protein [Salmonella enterica subsp. enterica serovar Bonn]EHA9275749.1 hypothetical protein [Salmonella enterica subsp. ente
MSHISHISHSFIRHIRHPVHPERRHVADSDPRISPATRQGDITADARILYDAGNKGNVTCSHRNTSERQCPGISFILNNRFGRVLVPQHDKLKNEAVISLCKDGERIYRDIMSGEQVAPTKDNVVKVMWYLQACASDKVSSSAGREYEGPQVFKMGAFSVEDNEHRLEAFLNKAGSYRRKSSHLREYQKAGAEYQPGGLDIFSKDGYLPHDRKTILFERMPQKSHATPTGIPGKNMLFIKMEEHGCHRKRDKIAHLGDFIPTLLEQRLGVVKTDTGTDNRERIPAALKKQYSDILSRYKQITGTTFSSSDAMSTTGGVKTILDDLYRMHNDIFFNINGRASTEDTAHFLADINSMSDTLRARDHAELRIGNEIILTRDETV